MLSISNIRIGTKLGVVQGASILLVAAIIGAQLWGNMGIRQANDAVIRRAELAQHALQIKSAVQGMQVGAGRIRLAHNVEELQKATAVLTSSEKIALDHIEQVLAISTMRSTIDTFKGLRDLVQSYDRAAGKIVDVEKQIYLVESKRTLSGVDLGGVADERASLEQRQLAIARDELTPIAEKVGSAVGELADALVERMNQSAGAAASELARTERLVIGVGAVVILLLLGAAIFGATAIARPLRKIAAVLRELTNDRMVDVPFTARGDEVGDIAKATEIFRQSIAQKIVNLRVRAGLDVVRSNVMIADDQYNIIYLNDAFKRMIHSHADEFRSSIPNLDPERLIGANIDLFHSDPAQTRKLLDQLTTTHNAQIQIGSQKFVLAITPVLDQHSHRVGTFVEWRNVTLEQAIEAEVDHVVASAVAGDFTRRIPLEGKQGFMLTLAKAVNSLCETTGRALEELGTVLSSLTRGDLMQRITGDYQGSFGKLKADTNAMADRIAATVAEIKASAREVTNAAGEISASTTDLSQRTEEQAASLEQTSASMEEMASTVKRNAESAQEASRSAAGTRETADRGGRVVAEAVDAMARIEEASQRISDIIGVIDEIARQTNLLALNAAVEAARAGDAGRGFAVVASEVRSLAQRSSQAAKDIKDLIVNSNGKVKEGVALVNRAGASLNEIVESIKKVAEIVSDIATASAEQSTGIEQINKALTQMDEVTQQNSALVEENAATAKTLEQQAAAMSQQVAFFRIAEFDAPLQPRVPETAKSYAPPVKTPVANARRSAAAQGGSARRNPVGQLQNALASAIDDAEWKDF
jgi:methyl-accepting chemotaxis protein